MTVSRFWHREVILIAIFFSIWSGILTLYSLSINIIHYILTKNNPTSLFRIIGIIYIVLKIQLVLFISTVIHVIIIDVMNILICERIDLFRRL